MEKIVERLKEFRDYKGLNDSALAEELGYKSSEKISRLFRGGGAKPSADIIEDIANKFADLNLEWWITGNGEMIKRQGSQKEEAPAIIIQQEGQKEDSYEKKYMTLLEEHLDIKKALKRELDVTKKDIEDFKESHRLMSEELNGLRHSLQVNLSVQLAFQDYWLHYFHKDRQQLTQVKKSIQRATVEFLAGMKQGGIEKAVGIESEDGSGRKKS